MSGQFLQLAGLATAAIENLYVNEAADWGYDDTHDYDSALLRTRDHGNLLVRRAASPSAAQELRSRSAALRALTPGVRARLPFDVPRELGGSLRSDPPFAVYSFVKGSPADRTPMDFDSELVPEIGRAIAAIHGLPKQTLVDAGLQQWSAADVRESTETLIRRADATGRLPGALADRWGSAVDDPQLWEFSPSVIHGSLERSSFLVTGATVSGVLGWSDLRIGDPAADIRWVQTLDGAVMRALLDEYTDARGASVDRQLRQRSLLYAELELARWLLFGVEHRNPEVVADAEQLLDGLVTRVRSLDESELRHDTLPVLDLEEVQQLLANAGDRSRAQQFQRRRAETEGAPEDLGDEPDDDLPTEAEEAPSAASERDGL
ncbi:phosphotransferase [Gulosibacter sp. ACHW.36C]|uniref:Phosphotransferase n=1 Tax=Gulosibacter sediminis TaxID=1729695 RepID=A0ABY4N1L1_9MICO|nr:phosphotransferase [Gulosibacter sediminis]UQN15835.1 phosphotransferase [Gulosibacter sediminis]